MPYSGCLRSKGSRRYRRPRFSLSPNVTPAHKVFLCLALASCTLGAALARPAPAAASPPCWKALLNDWYDGRIDRIYARHCYQDALKHLPDDIETYSSARDDILRALQSAHAKARRAGVKFGPNALIVPTGGSSSGKADGSTTTTTTTVATGRKQPKGLSGLADDLNPGSASSLPLPLLVLGALALLLVAAGATGLVVKRIQERRSQP
jgi:hypothetical protein